MNLDILKTLMNALSAKREFPTQESGVNQGDKEGEKDTPKSAQNTQNLMGAIAKFLGNFNVQNTQDSSQVSSQNSTPEKQAPAQTSLTQEYLKPPLQSGMLYTMTSHDSFIKRVKEKNQKS